MEMRPHALACLYLTLAVALASSAASPATDAPTARPNIIVILTDDLGFSDLGCYGSEIETPNLDRLAANGLRFTQFYNTAKCHSSRVSLLSGRWCRQAGDESLRRAAIIPEILLANGYFTAMTGKWHLSKQPTDFGFDRYFGHLSGACNYYLGDKTFRLNGQPFSVPEKGFYTTVANVDYALRFLGEARETKKPWFLYIAFNAPHAPLQPMEADYNKYLGKYSAGWDKIRAARVAKQKALGLFGHDVEPSSRPDHIPAWDSLGDEWHDWEGRRMAAYAGLIDRIDQEIGRLVSNLADHGELDNTLILFFSDNGACPYDRRNIGRDQQPFLPEVTWSDSTGWAWARNAPFRYYKQNQFEGGIATPAIAHWPAGIKTKPGAVNHAPAHLVDVLPTVLEIAGARAPDSWPDRELTPLAGISLAPILAGNSIPQRPPIHLLFGNDRGLRDGDWKLVSFRNQPWELYNLAEDRTELHDLAAKHPDRAKRMAEQWHDMAKNVLLAPPKEIAPVAETAAEKSHPEWTDYESPGAGDARRLERKAEKRNRARNAAPEKIRARVGTRLRTGPGQLILSCEGDDPGLAFDGLPETPDAGPYTLTFRLQSRATGAGEAYWTTDPKAKLPAGGHLEFPVNHDGQWQTITLQIPETKRLHALRLDPCGGPGEATIEGLTLRDASGNPLKTWP